MFNTAATYRPAPFWSWNDKLEPEVLRKQIREMHRAGLGGFFMHARGGLQTEYLSQEWDECVAASLDEAGKLGMDAWLYDENGWPSGFGGGLVNNLGVKYQQKYLRYKIVNVAENMDMTNHIGFYKVSGEFLGIELPQGYKGEVMRLFYEVNRFYVDNLDSEIVAEFIRVTHEHYWQSIPKELMKNLRGIFTDEPQLSRNGMLWSFVLEAEYRKSYGGELLEELAYLFIDSELSARVRFNFWKLATRLFSENFMKQIFDWCSAHNWELTGHHVLEESLEAQLSCNGAIMPQYQYYHVPGMDLLGYNDPSVVAMTQLVSVAMQSGRKQILTESFAGTSWHCNFSGIRWLYQQQLAYGINYLCPHLESYSLRGLRKRDYPASFFYHQPWWSDYSKVNDYFSKVGMLLAEGTLDVDVVILHPISSAWALYGGKDEEIIAQYTTELEALSLAIEKRQIPYHYADEQMVDDYGSVVEGKLIIGNCSYKQIIIPPLTNLSRKMFTLLKEFYATNPNISVVKNSIQPNKLTIDGVAATGEEFTWFNSLPVADMTTTFVANLEITPENNAEDFRVISTYRDLDDFQGVSGRFYFIANSNREKEYVVNIKLSTQDAEIAAIDEESFELRSIDFSAPNQFQRYLPAGGSIMLFVGKNLKIKDVDYTAIEAYQTQTALTLENKSQVVASSGNLLTLDRAKYRVDGKEWIFDDISSISTDLLRLKRPCKLELEFSFNVSDSFDFSKELYLICETPEAFKFKLNGQDFEGVDSGELFDSAFRKILLPKACKSGNNVIHMSMDYAQTEAIYEHIERGKQFETEGNTLCYDSEIECIYLWGDFSVNHINGTKEDTVRNGERYIGGTFELGEPMVNSMVDSTDLNGSGLPFFAGKVTIAKEVTLTQEQLATIKFLKFAPLGANSIKVTINGSFAGAIFVDPYYLEVASLLKVGKNIIEIELTTSLRNMLGPFHSEEGDPLFIGTSSFNKESDILGKKAPTYNKNYCFAKLGILNLKLGENYVKNV